MVTYLLIDDDAGDAAEAELYAETLMTTSDGTLIVHTLRPDALLKTLEAIAVAKPDGLLLDVALTNALTADRQQVGFDGIALAQQVRTLQTRGRVTGAATLSEFPLVRFSKKDVIREYVNEDTTSDDLFDDMIDKGEIADAAEHAARRIQSLAEDYPRVIHFGRSDSNAKALAEVLGCDTDFLARLDPRALLGLRRPGAPAHVLARYFTAKLLGRPGPLVDEALLAVRLGIDCDHSEDWGALKAALDVAVYRGAFFQGYPRWWHLRIMDWWQEVIDADRAPNRLETPDRVSAISAALNLRALNPLADDADSPGRRFWHNCKRSGRPVDPSHGFALLPVYGQESWQDSDYLCQEEAMRDPQHPRLSPTERGRLVRLLQARAAG